MPWIGQAQVDEMLALQRDLREGRLIRVAAMADAAPAPPPAPRLNLVVHAEPPLSAHVVEKINEWADTPRERAAMTAVAQELSAAEPPYTESHILRVLLNERTG